MDQSEYRNAKESGELVADAALQEEELEVVEELDIEQSEDEDADDLEETLEESEDDLPALSEKEQTAFEKRMERERAKLQEKMEADFKQKYARHDEVITMLGGDPDAIEKRIRDNQLAAQAQQLADQNGWSEEDTQWYINQQKQDQELKELRVQMNINKLRDNPDYAGIGSMEKEILSKIDKTNGALTVEEAYWALGGKNRAEQIRLEAQVRESVKRQKQPRTVLTDNPTTTVGDKPLAPEIAREAERMGISASEARRLMSKEPAGNIDEWRARKNKAK